MSGSVQILTLLLFSVPLAAGSLRKQGGPENPKAKTDVCLARSRADEKLPKSHLSTSESVGNRTALHRGSRPFSHGMAVRSRRSQTRPRHPSRTAWPSANPCRSARSHPAVKKTKREPKHPRCFWEKSVDKFKSNWL